MTLPSTNASDWNGNAKTEEPWNRRVILQAATKVFLAKGYVGTSMRLVAAESGVGRRTVYNQFESKKALFGATLEILWQEMQMEQTISRIETERPIAEALCEIGNAIANFWGPEAVAFARMVISESANFPELGRSYFSSERNPARHAVIQYFRDLDAKKALNILDPELAAAQFIGLIDEPLLLWFRVMGAGVSPTKERLKLVVDEAVNMFLCRYRPLFQV